MSPLLRALRAEGQKLRGTLALHLCAIAPAVVVLLLVLQLSVMPMPKAPSPPDEAWLRLAQGAMALWSFLMLPLFVTLQSALLAGLEHNDRQWKHLLALPLPRRVHYLAKACVLAMMVVAAMLVLVVLLAMAGGVLSVLLPQLGIAGPPPWEFLVTRAAKVIAASACIVALHTWLAIRWRSFTVAVAAGMSATVAGFLIGQSARFGPWYPWTLPVQMFSERADHAAVLVFSLVAGAMALLLGLWHWLRSDPE